MTKNKIITPIKAIRLKCLDCCAGSSYEVKLCPIADCPLYKYRFGKNPNIKRSYTEAQKQQARERIKRLHEQKHITQETA